MIRIAIVDDMPKARRMLKMLLSKIEDVEVVEEFGDAIAAMEYLQEHVVDLVFLDIEMPELSGIEAAHQISELKNPPQIAFLTAYAEYALEAWRTEALGYVLKPYNLKEIKAIISKYNKQEARNQASTELQAKDNMQVRVVCFPMFHMFVNETPVVFRNRKAKEIMAYLIHCKGGWVEINDLCANVLEDMESEKAKNNIRTYISRLKLTLGEYDTEDIVEHVYGKIRIDTSDITCDYYQYLEGETQLFTGEYLSEYSWAEPTLAMMSGKKH